MKVALMLTGLARKVQEGYDGYWKYIIDNNDVDLYLHAWESKPDEITNNEDSDDVLKVYPNPKYINIQKPIKFTKYREGIKTPRAKTFGASGSSVHSILKKYKIRQERLKKVNREYKEVWSDMEIKWERNNT